MNFTLKKAREEQQLRLSNQLYQEQILDEINILDEDEDTQEWFDKCLNCVIKKNQFYTFTLRNISFEDLYKIASSLFKLINKPKCEKLIHSELREPLFILFNEDNIDYSYMKYITCHNKDIKTYTIKIKNINYEQAKNIKLLLN